MPAHLAEKLMPRARAPFGEVLGEAQGVAVYSCAHQILRKGERLPSLEARWGDFVTGYKYQCVELARRYLLITRGVLLDSIPNAHDIFNLDSVRRVSDGSLARMTPHANGSHTLPAVGSLLIWAPQGHFSGTGHVAVITDVQPGHVDVIEQNVHDTVWPKGQNHSRRLRVSRATSDGAGPASGGGGSGSGGYRIHCTYGNARVLGWMNLHLNEPFEWGELPNCVPAQLTQRRVSLPAPDASTPDWLDFSLDFNAALLQSGMVPRTIGQSDGAGEGPSSSRSATYFALTASGEKALRLATNALHRMFLDATDYVFLHKEAADQFLLPSKLWPLIRVSWFTQRDDIVAARLDLALTERGLKVYEYNADSASCLLEAGHVQDKWSEAAGLEAAGVGRKVAAGMFGQLVATWKARKVSGVLHLMHDRDPEELYHTLYMKAAAEAAGLKCKLVVGVDGLSFDSAERVVDADGVPVKNVWKTWSWRTAIGQVTDADADRYLDELLALHPGIAARAGLQPSGRDPRRARGAVPKLPDVLLSPSVRVFEPLWTVVPASKSILPILCKIRPGHPYLLESAFAVTPKLEAAGYARKPVDGRGGKGVELLYSERDREGDREGGKEGGAQAEAEAGPSSASSSRSSLESSAEGEGSSEGGSGLARLRSREGSDLQADVEGGAKGGEAGAAGQERQRQQQQQDSSSGLLVDQQQSQGLSPYVYQELCCLPKYEGLYVQVNTWVIDGVYGATVLRSDTNAVVELGSQVDAIRVVDDEAAC